MYSDTGFIRISVVGIPNKWSSDKEMVLELRDFLKDFGVKVETYVYEREDEPGILTGDFERIWNDRYTQQCGPGEDSDFRSALSFPFAHLKDTTASLEVVTRGGNRNYYSIEITVSTLWPANQDFPIEEYDAIGEWAKKIALALTEKYDPMFAISGMIGMETGHVYARKTLYASWHAIYGKEVQEKHRLWKISSVPDDMSMEKTGDYLVISKKGSYSDFLKNGWSIEDLNFWKSIKAKHVYYPEEKTDEGESATFIVREDADGLYLEPTTEEKLLEEKKKRETRESGEVN